MFEYLFHDYFVRNKKGTINKHELIRGYKAYMYNRLMKMFKYTNLPKNCPQDFLEYYLLSNGSCVIKEYNGRYYPFVGSFGGEPDPLYRPTLYIIANPALKLYEEIQLYDVNGDDANECVFMRSDKLWVGLAPLVNRYANLLAENIITMRTADIMLRVVALLTASDDKTKQAGEIYLKKLIDGELSIVGENRFFDGLKMQTPPSNNGSYLTQFIELQQYYKGSFYNEIGLSASFNMKREAIGEGEATLNEDTLLPLIDTMLEVRKEDVSRLNDVYGLEVSVDFDSVWKDNREENELQLEQIEAEIEEALNGDKENNRDENYNGAGVRSFEESDGDQTDGAGEADSGEAGDSGCTEEGSEQSVPSEPGTSDVDGGTAPTAVDNDITIIIDSENVEVMEDEETGADDTSDPDGRGEEGEDSGADTRHN